MDQKVKIEVVVFSVDGALAAQRGMADRVELCENNAEGGTTPSYGTIKEARKKLSIDLHVMIRPRGGDFLYSETEYEIMQNDIQQCKSLGVNGVVFGMLLSNGDVDLVRSKKLVELAKPMSSNFHRAFDRAVNPIQAMEDIIECGFERILTSGQRNSAVEGIGMLAELVNKANKRIIIMPGGGVREDNIEELIHKTGAKEYHTSARCFLPSKMIHTNPGFISEGTAASGILSTDERVVLKLVQKVKGIVI